MNMFWFSLCQSDESENVSASLSCVDQLVFFLIFNIQSEDILFNCFNRTFFYQGHNSYLYCIKFIAKYIDAVKYECL